MSRRSSPMRLSKVWVAIAVALPLGLATLSRAATTISGGTYTGAAGSISLDPTLPSTAGGPGYAANGVSGTGAPYTISGGSFTGGGGGGGFIAANGAAGGDGLDASAATTITGGSFAGGTGGDGGGDFSGLFGGNGGPGGSALTVFADTTDVYGGTFTPGNGGAGAPGLIAPGSPGAPGYDFLVSGGTLNLFGTFTGGSQSITSGTGTVTGTLAGNTSFGTYSYRVTGGTLTIGATPEPAALGLLGAAATLLMRRRHRAGPAA